MTVLRWGAATHRGRVRPDNQDSVHAEGGLFVVADGMGGHRAGETASRLTVETFASEARPEDLEEATKLANEVVRRASEDSPELSGMGTTICALELSGDPPVGRLVNVGDSRAYRIRDGAMEQLTVDHSYVWDLVRNGEITEAEAEVHPFRNMLTRAIGIEDEVEVDRWDVDIRSGDRYLLCSDGLFNELTDSQIAAASARLSDSGEAARELIRLANDRGGRDNITVVIVDIDPPEPEALPAATGAGAETSSDSGGDRGQVVTHFGEDVAGPEEELDDGPRLTWRTVVFSFAVLGVILAALIVVGIYARDGAHVAFQGDTVVVYQGRSGGLLWFDPTLEAVTDLRRTELPESAQIEIEQTKSFSSVEAALSYVEGLENEATGAGS